MRAMSVHILGIYTLELWLLTSPVFYFLANVRAFVCVWSVLAAGASSSASTHWSRLAMTKCVVWLFGRVRHIQWRLRSYFFFPFHFFARVQVCMPMFTQANHYSGRSGVCSEKSVQSTKFITIFRTMKWESFMECIL